MALGGTWMFKIKRPKSGGLVPLQAAVKDLPEHEGQAGRDLKT